MRQLFCLLLASYSASLLYAQIDPHDFDYGKVDVQMINHQPDTLQTSDQLVTFINDNFATEQEKFRAISSSELRDHFKNNF